MTIIDNIIINSNNAKATQIHLPRKSNNGPNWSSLLYAQTATVLHVLACPHSQAYEFKGAKANDSEAAALTAT